MYVHIPVFIAIHSREKEQVTWFLMLCPVIRSPNSIYTNHQQAMRHFSSVHFYLMLSTSVALGQNTPTLTYPQARKTDHVDTYHGTQVADPYRWLEDDRSAETAAWVKAENKVTFDYLAQIPYRKQLQDRLEQVYNYPKYSAPNRKGEWYYFSKNDGLQNQAVLYRQKGLDGKPEVVIDPNKLSTDGTTRLGAFSLSKDGKYAVVGLSKGGSDWQEYQIMDIATKQYLPEKIEWVKDIRCGLAGRWVLL